MAWKIGDIVVGKNDTIRSFVEGKIVAQHENGNWIIQIIKINDNFDSNRGDLIAKSEWILDDYYSKKPSFFEVGKEYERSNKWLGNETALVMDTYHVDNALWDDMADVAVAKMTDKNGFEYMTLLNASHFSSYSVKE